RDSALGRPLIRGAEGRLESAERTRFLAEIADGLVQLHTQYYGKGPTRIKTYQVNDAVIALLEGGFTTVERTLIRQGNANSVHEMRRSFQRAMEERFRAVVEKATGRRVLAYMSELHTDPDLAMEFFLLEPVDGGAQAGQYAQEIAGEAGGT